MDRDDIIRMARESGVYGPFMGEDEDLERFAQLVEAALIKQGYRKCAEGQHATQFCGLLEESVLQEREACAQIAKGRRRCGRRACFTASSRSSVRCRNC